MSAWNPKEQEEIEYRIKCIKQFLELWVRYDEFFQSAYHGAEVTAQQEEEFLKLKSQCARRHQYIIEYMGAEYKGAEQITNYLSDTVTLQTLVGIHFDFYKKLSLQWHHAFLKLNEALGILRTHLEIELALD
ncbi:MAG: hypothetical protein GC154_21135 [bacterium]|nr:hypothetical protein [bacterium]